MYSFYVTVVTVVVESMDNLLITMLKQLCIFFKKLVYYEVKRTNRSK